jgi:hypothetical protein
MFGEWYQKTNKTEDTNKLTLLAFKIIIILHNTRLAQLTAWSGDEVTWQYKESRNTRKGCRILEWKYPSRSTVEIPAWK